MTPSSADTLDTLEPRTAVLAAYGALQNQPATAADLGQPYLFGAVVLVAVLAAVFVYWLRHKGLENQIKKLTKLAEGRDVQLHAANQKLKRLAGIDSVTEIANHSHFQEVLRSEWRRALREASSIAVIMVDVDHLKDYNDEFGHPGGDECLKQVAKALADSVGRPGDLVGRYGGGEFGAVLSRTDTDGAFRVAHKMCAAVEALAIRHPRSAASAHVTVSLGVASATPALDSNWEELELLASAMRALLQAKRAGRNRVVSDLTPLATDQLPL